MKTTNEKKLLSLAKDMLLKFEGQYCNDCDLEWFRSRFDDIVKDMEKPDGWYIDRDKAGNKAHYFMKYEGRSDTPEAVCNDYMDIGEFDKAIEGEDHCQNCSHILETSCVLERVPFDD